jgi:hypothetical protein
MGRTIDPTPAGACDACGRTCMRHELDHDCTYCHAGVLMNARWFTFWRDGYGTWHGSPREDIDLAELHAERERIRASR